MLFYSRQRNKHTTAMKALIDRTTHKVPTPNFGQHTKNPLVYFIDVAMNLELQRFLCPVNIIEYKVYLQDVLRLPEFELWNSIDNVATEIMDDHMASFLNEKSKDWYPVNENNEPCDPRDNPLTDDDQWIHDVEMGAR